VTAGCGHENMSVDRTIPAEIRTEIASRLDAIERDNDVVIVLACESGSRAWGFASTDSDYDVRFIYVNRPNRYLAVDLEDKRDVIETPIEGVWDVNGWDLRKALRLYRKSNSPLLEWLQSPIVYRRASSAADDMTALVPTYYSATAWQWLSSQ
jgi:predicted nucleotidyltransferase